MRRGSMLWLQNKSTKRLIDCPPLNLNYLKMMMASLQNTAGKEPEQ